ncbi:MAG TPA: hypothetical protein VMU26_17400 [Candidatus Polarisedimenticolia bacterium]|nr:hypothetical protein [Candidatus Polarisedimenticolia bacterium]
MYRKSVPWPVSANQHPGYESLAEWFSSEGTIGLFLDIPYQDRRGWNLIAGVLVLQMVCEGGASLAKLLSASHAQLVEVNAEHSSAMTELTALTKPARSIGALMNWEHFREFAAMENW